jgi:tetratricopeptide (TPR) repeat protein
MAGIYYEQKQFKLAIGYCEKCLKIKSKNVTLDVVYENMAEIYISFGQEDEGAKSEHYAKALDNLTKTLELCSCDNKKSGEIHGTIANLRRQLNDIDLAIKHYELSRDHLLNMSPRNYNDLLAVYEALIDGYQCCQNKQKVIENYELALNICLNNDCPQATKDLKKAAIFCHEIGVLYYESNNIEKAIEYTEQGLQLELDAIVPTSELEDQAMHSLACSYINLSTLYEESDDTEKQIVNLKKSLDIYRKFTSISSSPEMLCRMAQIYRDLGDCYEKMNDPVLALKHYQSAFNCLERSGTTDETKLIEYRQRLEKMEKLGTHTDK